jgi:hypothetical protein
MLVRGFRDLVLGRLDAFPPLLSRSPDMYWLRKFWMSTVSIRRLMWLPPQLELDPVIVVATTTLVPARKKGPPESP